MRRIAIINQKGGSGKTTTSVNLAAALALLNRKVMLVDLDPQASASVWFNQDITQKDILSIFTDNKQLESIAKSTDVPNLHIVSSSTWLMGLEKALANEVAAEIIFKQRLEEVDDAKFDYILVDCPPTLGILAISALVGCTEVVIPVESRVMALTGLVQLLQTIDIVKKRLNDKLSISGILACRVDQRTRHSLEIVKELRTKFSNLVYKTIIRENIRLSEASSFAKPIMLYDKTSAGSIDYESLAQEIILQEKIEDKAKSNSENNLNKKPKQKIKEQNLI